MIRVWVKLSRDQSGNGTSDWGSGECGREDTVMNQVVKKKYKQSRWEKRTV